jgi:putative ATP-dependent endonuclease of OLD family
MHIHGIQIANFRNFREFGVRGLKPGTVIVGANNIGKSNLLYALRLVLDPTLPDSARTLQVDDFWDQAPAFRGTAISITVDISGFDGDENTEAVLADFLVDRAPFIARLKYSFHPRPRLDEADPSTLRGSDYEYTVTGGTRDIRVTQDVRRMVALKVLPALRDAESDLQVWSRSPLRTLLEQLPVPDATLQDIADHIDVTTRNLLQDPSLADLDQKIRDGILDLVGPTFGIPTQLGIATSDPELILRAIRLLVEGGRGVGQTGLGAANVLFLALLLEDLRRREAGDEIASWIMAVEEPEAHLHPHLQREVFRTLLRSGRGVMLTTHSPQVVSVSPVDSILLLERGDAGTEAFYSGNAGLSPEEKADLERYIDAVRADFVFARAVMLVEGAGELWLVPAAAAALGHSLDRLGITICPVHGTSFQPYRKLLASQALSVPNVVVTDGDPDGESGELVGLGRGQALIPNPDPGDQDVLDGDDNVGTAALLERYDIFVGEVTLEADIAMRDPASVLAAFDDLVTGTRRRENFRNLVEEMRRNPSTDNQRQVVGAIERLGKGRFAQRLATRIRRESIPPYLERAINRVSELAST